MRPPRIAVVGGGIAGLATALGLADRAAEASRPLDLTLLEAGAEPGGNIRTEHRDGFTIEWGPNGFLDNVPAMLRLVERLDLADELRPAADAAAARFLFRHGRLEPLPARPLAFLQSPILSWRGRLRVLAEPFARARPEELDETIYEFASRRIGSEAAEVLVDAMVSGVFAGDTRRLSLAAAFPKMARIEAEHGGLVRAMIARGRARRRAAREEPGSNDPKSPAGGPAGPGGTLTSFRSGLSTLVEGLESALADTVCTVTRLAGLEPIGAPSDEAERSPRWRLVSATGDSLEVDSVVLAAPAARVAPLLAPVDAELAEAVGGIRSAPLAVVALAFPADEIGGAPEGFGFLAPRREGLRSLGCLWDSSIFPGRAPKGEVLLRVMIGGAHDEEAVELDDAELVGIARRDLVTTMGLEAEPSLERVIRHRLGIPQYERGHPARLERIERRLEALAGLWVAGSSYYGVSMNSCVEKAESQSEEIFAELSDESPGPAG